MADVQDEKPEVKPVKAELNTEQWIQRKQIEAELRPVLRAEYEQLLQMWKTADLKELEAANEKIITEGLKKLYDKFKEEQKPLTHEQVQQMLDQEYETFPLKVISYKDEKAVTKIFTLRELPQTAEKQFYHQFRDKVLAKLSALGAFYQQNIDRPFEEQAKAVLEVIDESFEVLADAVVICLNPFGTDKEVDRAWVQLNISSNRQWNIVQAQMEVNKLRDFFSKLSQSGKSSQMMMTNNRLFPQLEQLVQS